MQEEECLQRVRGGVDLVLDTTYCQPQYVFPRQEEVCSSALQLLDCLQRLSSFRPVNILMFSDVSPCLSTHEVLEWRALDQAVLCANQSCTLQLVLKHAAYQFLSDLSTC